MRTYEILNADGVKVGEQTHDDSMAPALLAGHTAKLVEIDGEKLAAKSRPIIGPEATEPVPAELVTEAEAAAAREAAKAEKLAAKADATPKDKTT